LRLQVGMFLTACDRFCRETVMIVRQRRTLKHVKVLSGRPRIGGTTVELWIVY